MGQKYARQVNIRAGAFWKRALSVFLFVIIAALASYTVVRAAVALSATMVDTLIDSDSDGKADPGEFIDYTTVITNSGSTDATSVEFDSNPDANTTFVAGSIAASAVALNDAYPETVLGNVSVDSALISFSVLSNDYLGQNSTATIATYDATSAQGGQVNMAPSGQFTYNPPAGFEGADTFTYTLSDNPNAPSAASNRTGTVTINVSGMVWFVNNNAAACTSAGCGRLSNPFSTLAAFNSFNDGTGNHPAANDSIFIYESATQYTGALALLSGQKLIGQDATASLSTISGLTPPSSSPAFPAMNSANGTVVNLGGTVTLNTNTTVRGLQINSTTSTGLADPAGAISGVAVSDISISSTTGTAVNLSNTSGTLTFKSISANGGTNGISLVSTSGSFTVTGSGSAGSGGTIQNTASDAIKLSSAQNVSLAYMNITNAASSTTNASCNFVSVSTVCEAGVELSSTTSVTLNNFVIDHNGGGMVGVAGLNVNGLTITNSTIREIGDTDSESGILLQNLSGIVLLQDLTVDTVQEFGIRIYQPSGSGNPSATLRRVTIQNNTGTFGESALSVRVEGGTSTFLVDDSDFIDTGGMGIDGQAGGNAGATLNMTVQNSQFLRNLALPHAITFTTQGNAVGKAKFTGNTTTSSTTDSTSSMAFDFDASDNSALDATVTGNTSNVTFGTGLEFIVNDFAVGKLLASSNTINLDPTSVNASNQAGMNFQARSVVTASSTGQLHLTLSNNTITGINATTFGFQGMNFQSGSSTGTHAQLVCAAINNNTVNGTAPATKAFALRQRTGTTFQIPGVSSGTVEASVESYIQGNNPGGSFSGAADVASVGGTTIINYTSGSCALPADPPLAALENDNLAAHTRGFQAARAEETQPAQRSADTTGIGPRFFGVRPAPQPAGGIVNVAVGTLPAGKSVTIKFRVLVNGPALPLGTTQISTQGTVSATNGTSTLTDDPALGGASDPTITPVDRPDTTIVSIARGSANPTNAASVSWTVTFANSTSGLTSSNFSLVNSGLGGAPAISSVTPVGGSPAAQWTVTASTGSGNGTLGLNLVNDSGLAHDVTNQPYTGEVYTIDRIPPSTTSFTRQTPATSPTNADTLIFRATFSEDVSGVDTTDFSVSGSTATATSVSPVSASVYDVTVSGGDLAGLDGTVGINFAPAMNITDLAGNALPNTAPSVNQTYVLDNTPPSTISFTRQTPSASPTNADTLVFRVTFSEGVTGVGTADFAVSGTTATPSGVATVSASVYDVTVSGGDLASFNGVVGLNFSGAPSIIDQIGNPLPGTEPTLDETYTVDNIAPVVNFNSTPSDPTSQTSYNFDFSANEAVSGYTCTLQSGLGVLSGPEACVSPVTGSVGVDETYTFQVSATDLAGNSGNASYTWTVETVQPNVSINKAAGQADPANSGPINFTVVFDEPVTDFLTGDVTLGGSTGATTATVSEVLPNDGTTYNVAVSGMTSDGFVTASIAAGKAHDAAGNPNTPSTSGDNSVIYDTAAPTVIVAKAAGQADPANSSPINFTVTFSEDVTGFSDASDVTLSGSAGATTVNITGGPKVYNVAVSGMTGNGAVTVSIPANAAQDLASQPNSPSAGSVTVNYDATAPAVSIDKAAGQADPTKVSPVHFTVVFTEAVTGFATGDVTLGGTAGATTAAVSEILPNNGTTYDVAVSGMTTGGDIIVSVDANKAQDASGNGNTPSTSGDNIVIFTFDTTTTITSDTPDPSLVGETVTFNYTVTVNGGSGSPSGNVTVSDGVNSCVGTVAAGSCTITFNTLGVKTVTAAYDGDTYFNTSTSAGVSHQVVNANTTTTITSDTPDPSNAGDAVTVNFNVAVVAPGTGTPSGNVTVSDGVDSCIGTAASGSCSITLTTPGIRTLTAAYAGDSNFGGSTSAGVSHTVNAAPAIISANTITFVVGMGGNFAVTATGYPVPSLSQTGSLPGGVTFTDNGNGTATLGGTPAFGSSGTYPLTFTASNGINLDATQNFTLVVSVNPIFDDVPNSYWAAPYINAIYFAGITNGCSASPMNYCPEASVSRAEMAVFIKRGIHGGSYIPPVPASFHFSDTLGHWAQNWIEDLYNEGITGGCGVSPASYCPNQNVTRAQMAVFLLRMKHGAGYTPPAATGTAFADVSSGYWAAAWIEQLAAEGITSGCGGGNYCPNASITRAQMAVLLVRTLNLPLP